MDLICIKELNLNSSFFSTSLNSLLCNQIAPTTGLAFSTTHASGGVLIFVRQGLSFLELSTFSFSLLNPYSDCLGINISLNNCSSLSFLNVYAPSIRSSATHTRTNFFFLSISSSSRKLFILGDFNCHHPLLDSKVLPTLVGRKYSIGSSPLTSFPSMTLNTYSSPSLLWQSLRP